MFPHGNIREYTWTSPDKTIHYIDQILKYAWMFNLIGELTNTDHYLVVAKLRDRLLVSKQASQQSVVDIFSLQNLNNVEVTEHYQIKSQPVFA